MKKYLKFSQTQTWRYEIHLSNDRFIGTFEQEVDGYFYYCFPNILDSGFVPAHVISELALKLEEINEPWDKIVEQQSNLLNDLSFPNCLFFSQ